MYAVVQWEGVVEWLGTSTQEQTVWSSILTTSHQQSQVSDKLNISCCLCPPRSNEYLMGQNKIVVIGSSCRKCAKFSPEEKVKVHVLIPGV